MTQTYGNLIDQIKNTIYNQPIPPHYNPSEWEGKDFNCYAYAMRACFDFNDSIKMEGIFPRPGFIVRGKQKYLKITNKNVIKRFKKDCKALGLQVLPTELETEIGANEYKIAIYIKKGYDYHFVRQDSNGEWSSKNGWKGKIVILKKEDIVKDYGKHKFIGIFRVSKK